MQEAVRDLEAVMQQKDSLAASLAEARRAGARAAKCANALHAEVEKLRQRSSSEAADRIEAKHTVASLQAQVCCQLLAHDCRGNSNLSEVMPGKHCQRCSTVADRV